MKHAASVRPEPGSNSPLSESYDSLLFRVVSRSFLTLAFAIVLFPYHFSRINKFISSSAILFSMCCFLSLATSKKPLVEKFFKNFWKKVLTNESGFDIIVKRSREAVKKLKAIESKGPWKLNNERIYGPVIPERIHECEWLWIYERASKALKKIAVSEWA